MPEGSYRFTVGALQCTALSDGYYAYPTEWFFPNAEPAALAEALDERRLPHESILSPYTCLLIETGRHVTMVDTGAGGAFETTGALTARLEMAGIRPIDVDSVVITHAHPDHLGGTLDARGRPRFPHATHYISEVESQFWTARCRDLSALRVPQEMTLFIEDTARYCLENLRHRIEPVDGEMEIVPGIRLLPAPGHTPGHLAVMLDSGGERLLNLADAAVHPLHLEHPEWVNGFDLEPELAAATRHSLLERAEADTMHVMAFHFPYPSVGRVEARDGVWNWVPGW